MARLIKHLVLLVTAGLVGAALVAPSAGAAPTWRPITNLFADLSAAGGSAQAPAVAIDFRGDATAIWSRYDGSQLVVQTSTRPAGGAWSAPVDLAAGRVIFNPQLVVDPTGDVTAVWRRRDVTTSVVQAATRATGGTWSAPVELSVDPSIDPTQQTDVPQVAVDAAGVVTAAWSRYDGTTHTAQAASRGPGGTWSTPVDLSAPGRSARTADLAVDPAGNATAVWVSGALVQAATRPAAGTWTAPVNLSTVAGSRANPRIVVDPAGTATAVWGSFTGTYGIQTATRPVGGTWTAAVDLAPAGQDTFDTPQLAVDRFGAVTALWQRHDGSSWVVSSATRTPGGSWTESVDLSATGHDAWDPQVAVDPAGNATAVWSLASDDTIDSKRTVQAARRPASGRWTASVDLSSGGSSWNPQVAVDHDGNATTTWSRHDGSSWIVQARGLDAAGPVVTDLTEQARSAGRRTWSVHAYDVWSRVRTVSWVFGDGTTASGTTVTHGGYDPGPVKVTLTDAVGNATVCTYTTTYACRSTTRVAPVISRVSLTHRAIRALGSHSDAPRSTKVKVVLNTDAKVTLSFRRAGTQRTVRVTRRGESGRNAFTVRARFGSSKTLRPGRWTITVRATNKAGASVRKKLRLRVVG